jgi:hypothetical protein
VKSCKKMYLLSAPLSSCYLSATDQWLVVNFDIAERYSNLSTHSIVLENRTLVFTEATENNAVVRDVTPCRYRR